MINRRNLLLASAGFSVAGIGAAIYFGQKEVDLGFKVSDDTLQEVIQKGQSFLANNISIDIHAHPGRSFVANAKDLDFKMKAYAAMSLFEEESMEDMRKGGLSVASFATVSDFQLLQIGEKGISAAREFKPDEAWSSYESQRDRIHSQIDENSTLILKPEDIIEAKNNNQLGILFTAEGGDFLEGSLDRLEQVYHDGLRSITLVHYHINEIGDIQTDTTKHKGLTDFGRELVKAMNEIGMIIDIAHASQDTAFAVLENTNKPVMVSHAGINREGFNHPRFINQNLALEVAKGGGLVGAWPAGIGLNNLSDYIDQIFHLIDAVGINHVAIGSDMDGNYKPVFDDYKTLPLIAGMLLNRGLSSDECAKILGGNFMRLFSEVS